MISDVPVADNNKVNIIFGNKYIRIIVLVALFKLDLCPDINSM